MTDSVQGDLERDGRRDQDPGGPGDGDDQEAEQAAHYNAGDFISFILALCRVESHSHRAVCL